MVLFGADYGLIYWGEQFLDSGLTAILFATLPLITVAFAHLYIPGDRITSRKLTGTLLAFVGVVALFGESLQVDLNTLGPMGAGTLRFVAITDSQERIEGPTFISPRNVGGDQTPHPEWAPDMVAALADLQRELGQAGWRKVDRGKQLWSWSYRR